MVSQEPMAWLTWGLIVLRGIVGRGVVTLAACVDGCSNRTAKLACFQKVTVWSITAEKPGHHYVIHIGDTENVRKCWHWFAFDLMRVC